MASVDEKLIIEARVNEYASRERRFGLTSDQVSTCSPHAVAAGEDGTSAANSRG